MFGFIGRHLAKIVIGGAVAAIVIVAVSEWSARRGEIAPAPQFSGEGRVFFEPEVEQVQQPPEPPPRPPSRKEQPVRQAPVPVDTVAQDTAGTGLQARQQERLSREIEELQKRLKEAQRRAAQLRQEEDRRAEARRDHILMLEDHAKQLEDLGKTLRQVFKTPRQIRIIAANLKRQASSLQAQIQSQSQAAGRSAIDREIWAEKGSLMESRVADLEAVALNLQRTGGDPSKVRIVAIQTLRKVEGLRATIENRKRQKIPPNSQLLSLERQQEALSQRIQELQQRLQAGVTQSE